MRLIDGNAIVKCFDPNTWQGEMMIAIANGLPTIDATPVVRCKECKHNRNCFIKEMIIAETKQDNPYCSCGAKMEDKPCE